MKTPVSLAVAALFFGAASIGAPSGAQAETLQEALASAYLNNPTLKAQRAAVRAVDESVPQAMSGWRPTVAVTSSIGRAIVDNNRIDRSVDLNPKGYDLTVTQPLFRGFRTEAAVERAKDSVRSAQAGLQSTEQDVLLQAASAYMDVIEAEAVVDLTENNVQVLQRQLDATRDRFRVGEVTRTDVAQAEARVSGAIAERIGAESDLQARRATYERVVGTVPTEVSQPAPVNDLLPQSLEEAVQLAITSRPSVVARQYSADAALDAIDGVRGELLPTVNVQAAVGQDWETQTPGFRSDSASVVVQATVPLYQAGAVYSRLRESKHTAGQRRLEVDEARFQAREAAVQSWENLAAARASIESLTAQVEAAQIALEGVQREAQVGARTVLDVLDQEQELLDARVNLVRAQRNEYVAAFQLLTSVGRMTVQALELPIEAYDPDAHYLDVRNQWIGGSKWAEDDEELAITGTEQGGPMGVKLGE